MANNRRIAVMSAGLAVAMLGLGYASVPLYRLFCQVTGYGGTPMRASEGQAGQVRAVAGRTMSVRFDANVDAGMPWRFQPEANTQTVQIGQRTLAIYAAQNLSDRAITGAASFNVAPAEAARYFTKVQCFCFNQQTLRPHETVRMPVTYYVDPAILNDPDLKGVEQITLSYTFHVVPDAAAKGA
ncbi:cytochrome c oxidase assembly protein [Novosphingobium sp. FSY-8]|uniref:Cytochrome c oxidase assembly protein CtaG n=1 Tax=Novosphingobium ovatum TaxID=1908523 RepID=A0ABW9XD80_9SPHN|nr:cytochrome c oxidase assembly protein [Novosphingobium ovatum]NBC36475.1 cytochrome c oxidase assembly protein [Novosphingobium ovatum]